MVIFGSDGEIRFSVFNDEPIHLDCRSSQQQLSIGNPTHIQAFHVKNMWQCLVNGADHPTTGATALHTSWVMEEILKQGSA